MNTSKFSALALPTSPGGANWAGHGPPANRHPTSSTRAQTILNAASARMLGVSYGVV